MGTKQMKSLDRACNSCRKSKSRCDKVKPSCTSCRNAKRDCAYNSGSSRHSINKHASSFKHTPSNSDLGESRGPATSFQTRATQSAKGEDAESTMVRGLEALGDILLSDLAAQNQQLAAQVSDTMVFNSRTQHFEPSPVPSQLWISTAPQLRWMPDEASKYVTSSQSTEQSASADSPTTPKTWTNQKQSSSETVLQSMAESTDDESSMILAALRLGVPCRELALALNNKLDLLHVMNRSRKEATVDLKLHGLLNGQEKAKWGSIMFDRSVWTRIKYAPTLQNRYEHVGAFIKGHPVVRRETKDEPSPEEKPVEALNGSTELPFWSITPMHAQKNNMDPFENALALIREELKAGIDLEKYCGAHAFVGALLDAHQFQKAPRLSQIVAALTRSALADAAATDITAIALMHLHWSVWSWLLRPTPLTYDQLPENMLPTPWQLFAPHCLVYDFCVTPSLRDQLCKAPLDDNHWISESCKTVLCSWPKTMLDAVQRNPFTGSLDLSAECKAHVAQTNNWSFGQNVRPYFSNIDRYINIRS